MPPFTLRVSELFYSLQGEGGRAGQPSIFIRLSGCSAKHACYETGVRCDTEFESGRAMTLDEILAWCKAHAPNCFWIVWTGGEPCDQLTDDVVKFFDDAQYMQAIETSGLKPIPDGIDWICISPKVAEHVLVKVHGDRTIQELRYVRHVGQDIPSPQLHATNLYLSPHSDGFTINAANLQHCIALCLAHPAWKLSVQQHKLWKVL